MVLIVNGLSGCKYAESFLNNLTNFNKFLSDDLYADVQMDKVVCESQLYDVCFDLLCIWCEWILDGCCVSMGHINDADVMTDFVIFASNVRF